MPSTLEPHPATKHQVSPPTFLLEKNTHLPPPAQPRKLYITMMISPSIIFRKSRIRPTNQNKTKTHSRPSLSGPHGLLLVLASSYAAGLGFVYVFWGGWVCGVWLAVLRKNGFLKYIYAHTIYFVCCGLVFLPSPLFGLGVV